MTDDEKDPREVNIDRELGRLQAEERREFTQQLERQFHTDEKIVRALAGETEL
jgi:hypothetical protein